MVKVFVAQTHPDERRALVNFLNYNDIDAQSFKLGHDAIQNLNDAIKASAEPLVVISSQSDYKGNDGFGNRIATIVGAAPARKRDCPALVIIYSRAVGQEGRQEKLNQLKELDGKNNLSVVFISKILPGNQPEDEAQIDVQHDAVKAAIDGFIAKHLAVDLK